MAGKMLKRFSTILIIVLIEVNCSGVEDSYNSIEILKEGRKLFNEMSIQVMGEFIQRPLIKEHCFPELKFKNNLSYYNHIQKKFI